MQNFLRRLQIFKHIFLQVIDVSEPFCIIVVFTLLSTLQCLNIVCVFRKQRARWSSLGKRALEILLLCIHSEALSNIILKKINDLM